MLPKRVQLLRFEDWKHDPVGALPQASVPRPFAVSLDKHDNLYVAGTGEDASSGRSFLARLNTDGLPDPTFGEGGKVVVESGSIVGNRTARVAALDDGTVVVAILAGKLMSFSRFDSLGNKLPISNAANGVTVDLQPFFPDTTNTLRLIAFLRLTDGANLAILKMEGPTKTSLLIIRAAADFSTYGTSRLIDSAPTTDWPVAVGLPDGTVVIAELTDSNAGRQATLRRMFPNSSFDATWGSGRAYSLGAITNITDLAIDFDTRLLVTGIDGVGGFVKRYKLVLAPFFETASIIEYFNNNLNHYFMTTDPLEVAAIDAGRAGPGWSRTFNGFRVYTSSLGVPQDAVRVCRFYGNREINPATGQAYGPNSHAYVLDGPECHEVRRDRGWIFESYAFYVYPTVSGECGEGLLPVHRAYNGRFAQNDSNHRFTANQATYQSMINLGWRGEGVVMCAPQQ